MKKTKRNKFLVIFKKEIRDLITVATIIPMIVMFGIFYFLGDIMKGMSGEHNNESVQIEQNANNDDVVYSQTSIIGFIDNDNSELSKYIEERLMYLPNNIYNGIIPVNFGTNDPEEAMKELENYVYNDSNVEWTTQTLLVIPKGFEENILAGRYTSVDVYSSIESFGLTSMISGTSSGNVSSAINGILSDELFRRYQDNLDADIDINYIRYINYPVYANDYTYLNGETENVNAGMILGYVSSQTMFLPMAIFFIIMMATQMLAGSIVNEKADKTLETIMTAPLKRMSVLLSKIFASAIYAVTYAVVYIIAYKRFMDSMGGDASYPENFMTALEKFGITFDLTAFLIIGVQLFLSVLCGLAISMLIGMMIEDIKTLQAYLTPLMFVIMIPYLLSMFLDINTLPLIGKILIYAIPFSHTFTVATNLFIQNWTLIAFGIVYQIIFVAVLLTIAVRIFNSDKLFTLGQLKKKSTGKNKFSFGKFRIG